MTPLLLALLFANNAVANRPLEALQAERAAEELESRDLERRLRSLDEQVAKRRQLVKSRVRALYKLSSGGTARLLLDADSAPQLASLHGAIQRILRRDFAELVALRDETTSVESDHQRHAESQARAAALDAEVARAAPARGFATRRGTLMRPVPGVVAWSFGVYKEPGNGRSIEMVRRGVEMRSTSGHLVHCVAPGTVAYAGEVAGMGLGVIVDHGDGWMSLVGRLRSLRVGVGDRVHEGTRLGEAQGALLFFALTQAGTPVNPLPWLRAPQDAPSLGDETPPPRVADGVPTE